MDTALLSYADKLEVLAQKMLRGIDGSSVLAMYASGARAITGAQALFSTKFVDEREANIHDIVMEHAASAERVSPGALVLTVRSLLEMIRAHSCGNHPTSVANVPGSLEEEWIGKIPTLDDLWRSVHPGIARDIVFAALELAGTWGKVFVEETQANVISVEAVDGYVFEHERCSAAVSNICDPRVLCIDGFIDNVSEVHHILEDASAAKEKLVVFARGMSNDVLSTINANNARGAFVLVPVVTKSDIDGINAISDIAVACGTDMVSSNKGDMLNNVMLSSLCRVKCVKVDDKTVTVMNPSSRRVASAHVKQLLKKRNESEVSDVAKMLDKRVRSMTPSCVIVRIPKLSPKRSALVQELDMAIRSVASAVNMGVVFDGESVVLAATLASAKKQARECFVMLESSNVIVA